MSTKPYAWYQKPAEPNGPGSRRSKTSAVLFLALVGMALVLAACQGDAESSGGVSAKNLDGIWRRDPEYYLQFKNSDKTFSYHKIAGYLELKPYDLGKFATEGTQLLLTSGERSRACTAETGTYEVSFAEDGTLNLMIVSDPCEERAEELQAGPWKRFTD